jgi:hypothetical protein
MQAGPTAAAAPGAPGLPPLPDWQMSFGKAQPGSSLPSSMGYTQYNNSSSLSVSPLFQPSPMLNMGRSRAPAGPSAHLADGFVSHAPSSSLPASFGAAPIRTGVSHPVAVPGSVPAHSQPSSGFAATGSAPLPDDMDDAVNGPGGDRRSRRATSSVSAVTRLLRSPTCAFSQPRCH